MEWSYQVNLMVGVTLLLTWLNGCSSEIAGKSVFRGKEGRLSIVINVVIESDDWRFVT